MQISVQKGGKEHEITGGLYVIPQEKLHCSAAIPAISLELQVVEA
jgi:hypothetical protein